MLGASFLRLASATHAHGTVLGHRSQRMDVITLRLSNLHQNLFLNEEEQGTGLGHGREDSTT